MKVARPILSYGEIAYCGATGMIVPLGGMISSSRRCGLTFNDAGYLSTTRVLQKRSAQSLGKRSGHVRRWSRLVTPMFVTGPSSVFDRRVRRQGGEAGWFEERALSETFYELHIDGNSFRVATSELVGVQIRALAAVNPHFDLILEGEGPAPDRLIGDDDRVSLTHTPVRIFTRPPTAMGFAENT
jgi:Multiubiquitin